MTDPGAGRTPEESEWAAPSGLSPIPSPPKSEYERRQILAQQIQMAATRGRRVESQSDFQAVLIEGKPLNHTLHAILTIFSCLIWGFVWAVLAGTGGERRELIVVDEWGNVQYQKLGKV